MKRQKVVYAELTSKAQEAFNAGKLAGAMARYGYELTPVRNDDAGADFIAYRVGEPALLIQLKGRPTIAKAYEGSKIWIAFPSGDPDSHTMYLVRHSTLMKIIREKQPRGNAFKTRSWLGTEGTYSTTASWLFEALSKYALDND